MKAKHHFFKEVLESNFELLHIETSQGQDYHQEDLLSTYGMWKMSLPGVLQKTETLVQRTLRVHVCMWRAAQCFPEEVLAPGCSHLLGR